MSNTGIANTGDRNTGSRNSGNRNTGDHNFGDYNTGFGNIGDWNAGNYNTANMNTGNRNTGESNTGDYNTGSSNTGDYNIGQNNTGNCNTGDENTGDCNLGNRNTGDCNIGNRNAGFFNVADFHTGFFNTEFPKKIYCFNQPVDFDVFMSAEFPEWLSDVKLTERIFPSRMRDKEKKDNPFHKRLGGHIRKNEFKQACQKAFSKATPEDIELTKKLPAFDAEVFFQITGIDLREEIVVDGLTYVRKD